MGTHFSSKVALGFVSIASVAAIVVACGTESSSKFGSDRDPASSGLLPDASFGSSSGQPDADLYANDPPPKWCGPADAGVSAPPPPGGTEECPDDKNKPGCGCDVPGEKRKCWTGLRKNRELGICKDGETVCTAKNETTNVWGPCVGEVLPVPGGKGKEACTCFSAGQWKIANLSPCTLSYTDPSGTKINAVSTILEGNQANCPAQNPPTAAPTQIWSTDTLKVDCAGHFKLCLRIRQGVFESPNANDCILSEVCTESDYVQADVEQAWPDLPGWLGKDQACAKKWHEIPQTTSPGYAEMIVKGTSVLCDAIDDGAGGDLVFNRVKYCPRSCNDPQNASSPECVKCQLSGQGEF